MGTLLKLPAEERSSASSASGATVFYNLWNSGTKGLRFFKARLGLVEGDVEWALT